MLGPHLFPRTVFVPSPFTETRVTLRQGVVHLRVPDFPVFETNSTYDVDALGATEALEFAGEFFDGLELSGIVGGQVMAGTDIDSILTLGSSYAYYYGGGAVFRLFTLDRSNTLVSLQADGTHSPGGTFDLLRMLETFSSQDATVQDAVEGRVGRLVLSDLERTSVRAHVIAAQSLGRNFGLQASAGIAHTWFDITAYDLIEDRDVETTHRKLDPDLGVAVDGNLSPWLPFLGLTLEYSLRGQLQEVTNAAERTNGLTHLVAAGINYLEPRFQIGLAFGRAFGFEPLARTAGGETQLSGGPSLNYGRLLIHVNW